MRVGRIADAIDVFNGRVERCVVSDRRVGAKEVVVDGARRADHGIPVLVVQLRGATKRAVAANGHERVDAVLFQVPGRPGAAFFGAEFLRARALQDGSAGLHNVRHRAAVHLDEVALDHALVAAADANDVDVARQCRADDGAQTGIHAGGVAATRVHAETLQVLHGKRGMKKRERLRGCATSRAAGAPQQYQSAYRSVERSVEDRAKPPRRRSARRAAPRWSRRRPCRRGRCAPRRGRRWR